MRADDSAVKLVPLSRRSAVPGQQLSRNAVFSPSGQLVAYSLRLTRPARWALYVSARVVATLARLHRNGAPTHTSTPSTGHQMGRASWRSADCKSFGSPAS